MDDLTVLAPALTVRAGAKGRCCCLRNVRASFSSRLPTLCRRPTHCFPCSGGGDCGWLPHAACHTPHCPLHSHTPWLVSGPSSHREPLLHSGHVAPCRCVRNGRYAFHVCFTPAVSAPRTVVSGVRRPVRFHGHAVRSLLLLPQSLVNRCGNGVWGGRRSRGLPTFLYAAVGPATRALL